MYWFSDPEKKVLYVGKAKNLKNRVTSYKHTAELSPRIARMTAAAKYISWQPLESELQALLTEAELINIHQPPFNVLLKDDKTPLYISVNRASCLCKRLVLFFIMGTAMGNDDPIIFYFYGKQCAYLVKVLQ